MNAIWVDTAQFLKLLIVVVYSACWGSFLNSAAYRLLYKYSFLKIRSYCTHCFKSIAPYDLIPVISYIMLRGRCRQCGTSIFWGYPLVECISAIIFPYLFFTLPIGSFCAYVLFVSMLLISFYTDARTFVLLRPFTLGAIPLGIGAAILGLIPLTLWQSLAGTLFGWCSLAFTRWFYRKVRNVEGLGNGDQELLAGIGAWIGPLGCLTVLLISSIGGSLWGLGHLQINKNISLQTKFPFGPFLIGATLIWLVFQQYLTPFLYHLS